MTRAHGSGKSQMVAVAKLTLLRTVTDYRAMGVALFAVVLFCLATVVGVTGETQAAGRRRLMARDASGAASLEGALVLRPLCPLFFIRSEIPGALPASLVVVPDLVDQPIQRVDEQQLIRPSLALDWASIVAYLFSLAALLASHDLIVEQKERGTLRVVLSYPVKRWTLLLGGVAAISTVLVVFLVVSVLVGCWILAMNGHLSLARPDMWRLLAFVMLGSAFVLAMVVVGATISCLSYTRHTALAAASLIWVVWAVFLPYSGGPVAAHLCPVPSELEFLEQLGSARAMFAADGTMSSRLLTEVVATAAREGVAVGEVASRVQERLTRDHEAGIQRFKRNVIALRQERLRELEVQATLARRIAALSPITGFIIASEAIADTGWPGYREFYENTLRYMTDFTKAVTPWRASLRQQAEVVSYGVEDGGLSLRGTAWLSYRKVPFDVSNLPAPDSYVGRRGPIRSEVWYFACPALVWLLLSTCTAAAALWRYDAR